ncbi:MAG: hypothetical protein JWO60_1859, partial [Frankiales bacterium]|nr:hypothetical protein [Frankiales bacterium]
MPLVEQQRVERVTPGEPRHPQMTTPVRSRTGNGWFVSATRPTAGSGRTTVRASAEARPLSDGVHVQRWARGVLTGGTVLGLSAVLLAVGVAAGSPRGERAEP